MSDWDKTTAIYGGLVFPNKVVTPFGEIEGLGVSKRELFAAMALSGLLSNEAFELTHTDDAIVQRAVEYTDRLLKELNK